MDADCTVHDAMSCFQVTDQHDTSSALHLAARNGHLNIVQILVQCQYNINAVVRSGDVVIFMFAFIVSEIHVH